MPVEAKPLFRPDVLRLHLGAFALPDRVDRLRPKLGQWADLLASRRADALKEQELLPDFITDFCTGCSVTSVRPREASGIRFRASGRGRPHVGDRPGENADYF